jgi:hypothetical protein
MRRFRGLPEPGQSGRVNMTGGTEIRHLRSLTDCDKSELRHVR